MNHPLVTPELVSHLDEAFPNQCPDLSMSDREIWMAAGAARVVAGLKAALAEQTARAINIAQDPSNVLLNPGHAGAGSPDSSPLGGTEGPGNRCSG